MRVRLFQQRGGGRTARECSVSLGGGVCVRVCVRVCVCVCVTTVSRSSVCVCVCDDHVLTERLQ